MDEIAVCPVGDLGPTGEKFNYRTVPFDMFLAEAVASELCVGPGDDVFMVGRFVNHAGRQRNLPSVRFGHIAIMPDKNEKIPGPDGISREGYLVEASSYPGYSGSPVFLYTPTWAMMDFLGLQQSPRQKAAQLGQRIWLLGVNWGHLPVKLDAKTSDGFDLSVTLNAGMMCVAPAWKLQDVLNLPELTKQRAQERELWKAEGGATFD